MLCMFLGCTAVFLFLYSVSHLSSCRGSVVWCFLLSCGFLLLQRSELVRHLYIISEPRATVVQAVNWFKPLLLVIYYWPFQSDATLVIYSVLSFTLIIVSFSVCLSPFVGFLGHSRGSLQGMGYSLSHSLVLCYTWCHPWCLCHFPVWFLVQGVEFDTSIIFSSWFRILIGLEHVTCRATFCNVTP